MRITDFIDLFSTREQAIAILTVSIVLLLTSFTKTRKPLFQFIKQVGVLLPKLWILFLSTAMHVWLVYLALNVIGLWTYRLIDDLAVFYFIAIGLIFKVCKQDYMIFREEVANLFVGSVFLFAILDEGTFPLTTELIFLPVITFIFLMGLMAKESQFKIVIKKVLSYFGWIVFLYAFYSIMKDLIGGDFEPIYEAALSVTLPISFIPVLYLIYLLMEYEILFQAVGRKSSLTKGYRRKLKIAILMSCLSNPQKLRRMRANLFLIDCHEMSPLEAAKFLSLCTEFDTKTMSRY
jgi:hypothetical protein